MKPSKCFAILLFCFVTGISSAHELDSLLKKLPEIENENSKIELWEKIINISIWQTSETERKKFIDDLWEYSNSRNNEYGIATAHLAYAKHFERDQDLQTAKKHAKKAYDSFEQQNNKLGLCKVLRQQAYIAYKSSNTELANELAHESLQISLAIQNRVQEGLCLNQLGMLVFDTQHEEGIKLLVQALNLLIEIDAKREASYAANALVALHLNLRQDSTSIEYLDLFFDLQKELNDIGLLAEAFANAAIAYNSLGDFEKAEEYIKKSGEYYLQIDSEVIQARYFRMKSLFYRERGSFHEAIANAQKALSLISEKEGLDTEKGKIQYTLFLSYRALKKYEEALVAYENAVNHEFSLYDSQTTQVISELKEKYESDKKEQENENLKQINEINRLEIARKEGKIKEQRYLVSLLSLLVISLIIGFLFYKKTQSLKEEKTKRKLEQQVFRSQMNPHFIFNSLNSIQRMYIEGNTEEANEFLTEFSRLIRSILENSNHSQINLNEELNTLRAYLELEKLRTKHKFDYTISIDETVDQYSYQVPPLIIQPFVENAIWHGILPGERDGKIEINLKKESDKIHVEIIDNGIGFTPSSDNTYVSHGIKITEKRIESKVKIQSSTIGTKIEFKI